MIIFVCHLLQYSLAAGILSTASESLFTYKPGESFSGFRDPSFTPRFQTTFTNSTLEAQAMAICGDDPFCLFDIAATGRTEIGASTVEGSRGFDLIMNLSVPSKNGQIQHTKFYTLLI